MAYQNPYNPFPAYTYNQNQVYQGVQQVIKVNGRNGAEAFRMGANSSVLLLDETEPIVWLKQTDGAGYPIITAYDIKLHQDLPLHKRLYILSTKIYNRCNLLCGSPLSIVRRRTGFFLVLFLFMC